MENQDETDRYWSAMVGNGDSRHGRQSTHDW